jgi:1,2-diacylglycerol 3-alpha-glucosyltransferase
MSAGPRLCYFVERLGPYHVARLNEVARSSSLSVCELRPEADTYLWTESGVRPRFEIVRISGSTRGAFARALNKLRPDVVFVNGWSDRGALLGLGWCRRNHVPVVLMSDSQRDDEPRTFWKERVKRLVVRCCDAGFVAGRRHVQYLQSLGMGKDRIVLGYDVVDNEHFANTKRVIGDRLLETKAKYRLPENYFLASARFIPKKNLATLIRAYSEYRKHASASVLRPPTSGLWSLVILGDGPLQSELRSLISDLGLEDSVLLPGFKQYDELPIYYGLANAFIHASTTEQWGLVVNEAMAAGLPVIVSQRCGCVPELVHDGINGFQFDPQDEPRLAQLMIAVAAATEEQRAAWGEASRRIIRDWSLDRFAQGIEEASAIARQRATPNQSRFLVPLMLNLIARLR